MVFVASFKFKSLIAKKQDCISTPWSEWSECSRNCAGGSQLRTRSILVPPSNGGDECNANDFIETRPCFTTQECGRPCIPGDPTSVQWTPCPLCVRPGELPMQWKIVPPIAPATTGGLDCSVDQVYFTKVCDSYVPTCAPDIDCVLSAYTTSSCNVVCGSGTEVVYRSISTYPSGNGIQCNLAELITQQTCYPGSCNCDNLNWSGTWSECNASCGPGITVMLRTPSNAPNDTLCPYVSTTTCQFAPCPNSTCIPAPIDLIQAMCYLQCAGLPSPPLDPLLCSSTEITNAVCGFDQEFSENSGNAFDALHASSIIKLVSGFDNCAAPSDCELSTWSDWSACSRQCNLAFPLGGIQVRTRYVISNGNSGGVPCSSLCYQETRPCNSSINQSYTSCDATEGVPAECTFIPCEYTPWTSYSTCSGECGPGFQTFTRQTNGAADCSIDPSTLVESRSCNNPPCVQCKWDPLASITINCDCDELNPTRYFTQPVDVILRTNTNFFPPCSAVGRSCSVDAIPVSATNVCKSYYRECNCGAGLAGCPYGCNYQVCNGQGTAIISDGTCTCECFNGWSGENCSTKEFTCPVASFSGVVCNGVGTCNANGTCNCPSNDTTPDCTGADAYCLVYGAANADFSTNSNEVAQTGETRKLLGAIQAGTFSQVVVNSQTRLLCAKNANFKQVFELPLGSFDVQDFVVAMNKSLVIIDRNFNKTQVLTVATQNDFATFQPIFNQTWSLDFDPANFPYTYYHNNNTASSRLTVSQQQMIDSAAMWGFDTQTYTFSMNTILTATRPLAQTPVFTEQDCFQINSRGRIFPVPSVEYYPPSIVPYGFGAQQPFVTLTPTNMSFQSVLTRQVPTTFDCIDTATANLLSHTTGVRIDTMKFRTVHGSYPPLCESIYTYTSWQSGKVLR